MAARKAGSKILGKTQAWGIARLNDAGKYELVVAAFGRQEIRNLKRSLYPGLDFKTVKVNATLEAYTK